MKQDCTLCTRQYPVLQKMTDLIRQQMCIKFCFKSVKTATETFEMLKKPQTIFLVNGLALCPKGAMGVHSSVKCLLSFFSLARHQNVHHKFITHTANCGETFLGRHSITALGKMCGENNMRGDPVETGLIAMRVLLTTLLCMCRNFWLIMA